jgi:hypothetical protein
MESKTTELKEAINRRWLQRKGDGGNGEMMAKAYKISGRRSKSFSFQSYCRTW